MFEIALTLLTQLILLIPAILAIYILFDLIGSLFFGGK